MAVSLVQKYAISALHPVSLGKRFAGFNTLKILDVFLIISVCWVLSQHIGQSIGTSLFHVALLFCAFSALLLHLWKKIPADEARAAVSARETGGITPQVIPVLTSAGVFLSYLATSSLTIVWTGVLFIAVIQSVQLLKGDKVSFTLPRLERDTQLYLWVIALVCVIFAMTVNRVSVDDANYLNRAAYVADHFFETLPTYRTFFEGSRVPAAFPFVYYLSLDDFNGFLSFVTGLQPLEVNAYILVPLLSLLAVMAYFVLAGVLFPQRHKILFIFIIFFLLIDGSSYFTFAHWAFARIWQGKSVAYHILMPLAMAYGLCYGSGGGKKLFLRLFLINTAAIGFSPISVWLVTTTTGCAVIIGALGAKGWFKRTALAVVSCIYPVLFALIFYFMAMEVSPYFQYARTDLGVILLGQVFPSERSFIFWLAVILVGLNVSANRKLFRFSVFYTLFAFAIFLNPLLSDFIANYITSKTVYERVVWLYPVHIIGASVLLYIYSVKMLPVKVSRVMVGVIVLVYVLYIPKQYLFQDRGGNVSLGALKVPRAEYEVAQTITHKLEPFDNVLVAPSVSWLLPMFRGYVSPQFSHDNAVYYLYRRGLFPEYGMRECLMMFLERVHCKIKKKDLYEYIINQDVKAVVYKKRGVFDLNIPDEYLKDLVAQGLYTKEQKGEYVILFRQPDKKIPPEKKEQWLEQEGEYDNRIWPWINHWLHVPPALLIP